MKTISKSSRKPRRLRRAKTLFGALVATAALVMAVQVVAPVSAMAMIDTSCEDLGDCTGAGGDTGGGSVDQGYGGGDQSGGWDDGGSDWGDDGGTQGSGQSSDDSDEIPVEIGEVIVIEDTKPAEPIAVKDRYCASLGGYIGATAGCPPQNGYEPFLIPKGGIASSYCPDATKVCFGHLLPLVGLHKPRQWTKEGLAHAIAACQLTQKALAKLANTKKALLTQGVYSHEFWKDHGLAHQEKYAKEDWDFYTCGDVLGGQS